MSQMWSMWVKWKTRVGVGRSVTFPSNAWWTSAATDNVDLVASFGVYPFEVREPPDQAIRAFQLARASEPGGPKSASPILVAASRCMVGVTWLYRLVNRVGSAWPRRSAATLAGTPLGQRAGVPQTMRRQAGQAQLGGVGASNFERHWGWKEPSSGVVKTFQGIVNRPLDEALVLVGGHSPRRPITHDCSELSLPEAAGRQSPRQATIQQ